MTTNKKMYMRKRKQNKKADHILCLDSCGMTRPGSGQSLYALLSVQDPASWD